MNSSELRIGNFVMDEHSGEWMRVTDLSKDNQIIGYLLNREKFPLPEGWQMTSIPVTEEILIRFGFIHDKQFNEQLGKQYYLPLPVSGANKNEIFFFFPNTDVNKAKISGRAGTNGYHSSNNINYVHQLQNLYFALTGEEIILAP